VRPSRRRFIAAGSSFLATALGVGAYTWKVEPHWLEVVLRPLAIRFLPTALVGRTLVQLSDLHVGLRVDDGYVLSTFDRVSALHPDIVVMTGDFMSHHPQVYPQLRRVYSRFPRGRLATLAILGNHDYGPNWSHPDLAQGVVDTVGPLGITVLRNQLCEVEGLQILGFDDVWATRFEPREALGRLDRGRAALALSHNPDTVDLPVWNGFEGWILSGHTHGGQCKPPFLPPPLLPVRNRRYTAGEFALSGNRRLYISRGVGHLLQVRFNVRPEVTVFELQRAT
jgi:predicted MPP superfamily phosphohydrolase